MGGGRGAVETQGQQPQPQGEEAKAAASQEQGQRREKPPLPVEEQEEARGRGGRRVRKGVLQQRHFQFILFAFYCTIFLFNSDKRVLYATTTFRIHNGDEDSVG